MCSVLSILLVCAGHVGTPAALDVQRARLTGTVSDVEPLLSMADLQRRQGQWDAALESVAEAAAWLPDDPRVLLQRGLTHAAAGHDGEALADLSKHLEAGGDAVAAYVARATVLERQGRLEEALRDWMVAAERSPDPDNVLARGRVQVALGRLEDAARDYEEALGVLTGAVVVQQALLDVDLRLKRYDVAIARINTLMAPLPVKAPWIMRRADVQELAGRTRKARADRVLALHELDSVLEKRMSPNFLVLRAQCRWRLEDISGARRDVATALDIQPDVPGGRELLALVTTRRSVLP